MNKKMDFNALTAVFVMFMGIIYLIMSIFLPRAAIGNAMDPLYFPIAIGVLLTAIGLLLFLKSDKSMLMIPITTMFARTDKDKEVSKMVFLTCVSAILYGILFEHLGFVISTFAFMTSILFVTNGKKYLVNFLVASIFSVSIFALFNYALGIPLPGLPFL